MKLKAELKIPIHVLSFSEADILKKGIEGFKFSQFSIVKIIISRKDPTKIWVPPSLW